MQTNTDAFGLNIQGLTDTINVLNHAISQVSDHAHQLYLASNTPVQDDDDALQRADLMDMLMDMAKSEEDICMIYAHAISDRIEEYETEALELPKIPAVEMLKGLMEIRGTKQKDLSHIAGQSTISEILNGKRQITKNQAKALAEYFDMPLGAFID
ncbi:MAG: DNA-binding protein [Oceanospirillaceae bacterium]|nr:DNA-binding protein [Oceanospirillaceae bacterium]